MMDGLLLPILMFGALGLMMVFGMRKQKRQAAETQKLQDSVVPGARIMTTSGLHGTVTAVADDTIELEIAPGVYTTWARAAVRQVIVPVPTEDDFASADEADASRDGDESRQTDVG
jgi:preprotein translocase subunit YajC